MVRDPIEMIHPSLVELDAGEREAIQIALEAEADLILMDDAEGRVVAKAVNLSVQGTLGVLERAARLGWCDFRRSLAMLDQTSFRMAPRTREMFIRRNR